MAMLYSSEMILRFPMKPEMFEGYFTCLAPLFKWLGFFPAPKYENRGSGGVQAMIDRLNAEQATTTKPICIVISPKGTILNWPWRSGYRHIAKGLAWPIKVLGVDFSKRTLEIVDTTSDEPEHLQAILSNYCPFIPRNAEYPLICDYDPYELTLPMDLVLLSNLAILFPGFKALFLGHWFTLLQIMLTFIVSWKYHASKECQHQQLDGIVAKLGAAYILYTYPLSVYAAIPGILGYYCYEKAIIKDNKRGSYIYYHSLFHILMSIGTWIILV
jgi:hypothetical protein